MYEKHFGLTKQPFPGPATAADVFVGPQAATIVAALEKGLIIEDAVVAVSGPAGVGKTTIVRRALDAVGDDRIVVSVGRIQLGHDEVIELLMAGLGARKLPKSTVHRFAAFRRLLQKYAEQHKRVLIVVEDATRVGIDALSELEALTAEDAGVSAGASIVLMGDEELGDLLRESRLSRLRQRVRARKSIAPMNKNEMRGYLKHCLRVAGGDFDSLFASGAAELLHDLSEGTPRVANNLVKSTLNAAAEADEKKITLELIKRIADEEFGLTVAHSVAEIEDYLDTATTEATAAETGPDEIIAGNPSIADTASAAAAVEEVQAAADHEPAPVEEVRAAADYDPAPVEEVQAAAEPEAEPAGVFASVAEMYPEPVEKFRAIAEPAAASVEHAPPIEALEPIEAADVGTAETAVEEIEDSLPDHEILTPDLVQATLAALDTGESSAFEPDGDASSDEDPADTISELPVLTQPQAEDENEAEDLPTLFTATETDLPVEPTGDTDKNQVPAWERDPTLAELKPDLDALERAMALAHGKSESDTEESWPDQPEAIVDEVIEPAAKEPEAKEPEATGPAAKEPEAEAVAEEAVPAVPEITLDRQIQEKIDEATEALRQTQTDVIFEDIDGAAAAAGTPTSDTADNASNDSGKDTAELKQIATALARAKSIDDVDDNLAETLFGEEFSVIAAAVLAKAKEDPPANDEMELQLEQTQSGMVAPAADIKDATPISVAKHQQPDIAGAGVDGSPSQRLATVRALNASTAPAGVPPTLKDSEDIVMSVEDPVDLPPSSAEQPTSIEDQIETSMTATLEALRIRPDAASDDDDEGERKKGGFLSRFRRS